MLASRLASCAATNGGETQQDICYLRIYVQRRVQPVTVESREASALASALPRRASTSEEVSTVERCG